MKYSLSAGGGGHQAHLRYDRQQFHVSASERSAEGSNIPGNALPIHTDVFISLLFSFSPFLSLFFFYPLSSYPTSFRFFSLPISLSISLSLSLSRAQTHTLLSPLFSLILLPGRL